MLAPATTRRTRTRCASAGPPTLSARLAVADAGTSLFSGLGAVALLVGGIGIANVMVIAVLERRTEIGLRRAPGAGRRPAARHGAVPGGVADPDGSRRGVRGDHGVAVTYSLALQRGWQPLIPAAAVGAALGTAILVGAVAGLYPAVRAARLSPTDALRTG